MLVRDVIDLEIEMLDKEMDRYGNRDGYKIEVNMDIEMKLEIET